MLEMDPFVVNELVYIGPMRNVTQLKGNKLAAVLRHS
jgi:hypothetical protein